LLGKMQIYLSERRLMHIFSKYKKNDLLQEKDIFLIIQEFTLKDELTPVFKQYTSNRKPLFGEALMTRMEIKRFFAMEQCEFIREEQITELLQIMAKHYHKDDNGEDGISLQCFGNMLFSIDNSIFHPQMAAVYQVLAYLIIRVSCTLSAITI
jgi:hypothetical protein